MFAAHTQHRVAVFHRHNFMHVNSHGEHTHKHTELQIADIYIFALLFALYAKRTTTRTRTREKREKHNVNGSSYIQFPISLPQFATATFPCV